MGTGRWPDRVLLLAVGAEVAVVIAAALPWARSGHASRNSFQLVHAAQRLDVLEGAAVHAAPVWFVVPALVAVGWLAATLRRPVAAAVTGITVGVIALFAAVATMRSPLEVEAGVPLTVVAAAVAVVASTSALAGRRLLRRRGPDGPRHG